MKMCARLAAFFAIAFAVGCYDVSNGTNDAGPHHDAGVADTGHHDAGGTDAGGGDAGTMDAGAPDAGEADAGTGDAGNEDAGAADASAEDAGTDAGTGLCDDQKKNGNETDVDCGGSCCPCADGRSCVSGNDCVGRSCRNGTCQPPACDDGIKNGQECGVDCGGTCPAACATAIIFSDTFGGAGVCPSGCTRDVQGGLLETGGWTPQDGDSRIVYDFGRHVDCGRVVVEVDNFDPWSQFQPRDGTADPYTEFISVFDGLEDKPEDRFDHNSDYSQIDVVYPPACLAPPCTDDQGNPVPPNRSIIKANTGLLTACDWDSGRYCNDCMQEGKTRYTFELRWTPVSLSLWVDGVQQTEYPYPTYPSQSCSFTCRPKTPELRHLYINRPMLPYQGYLVGPRYTKVEVEAVVP